jgi:hypothetical protein
MAQVDVEVHYDGSSLVLFEPKTESAHDWIADHLPEDVQFWAGSVVVEWRYADDIAYGMRNDGLEVRQ